MTTLDELVYGHPEAMHELADLRVARDRWYAAAGQRQDELNEAHRALAWVAGSLPFDSPRLPEHLRVPDFVRRQVSRAKAAYPTRLSTLDEWWRCPDCGPGVASDEDGCCTTCGADLVVERRPPPHATDAGERAADAALAEGWHEQEPGRGA